MKKTFLMILFTFLCLSLSALEIQDIQVTETSEEIRIQKNKYLKIEISDLLRYEKISRTIDRENLISGKTSADNTKLQAEFDAYLFNRLNMIRKVFVVFRDETLSILNFLEKCEKERLPAFKNLIKTLNKSISEAWLKGNKEKWQDMLNRTKLLLLLAKNKDLSQQYKDQIILAADDISEEVFLAKVALLHRWLLNGRLTECQPLIASLPKKYAEKAEGFALHSHYTLEQYKLKKNDQNYPKALLHKSFFYYVEALKKGYPQAKEIPGLLPEFWSHVLGIYEKIRPYWTYPDKYANYRQEMKEMANLCRSIIIEVPCKKYAEPAYKLISDIYKYWPTSAGAKIIDYPELIKLSRIVGNKKL